ncbi:hypothetical protein INP57_05950 [Saccharopolyspora sp. HNM0986]|uniref:hypothetical protein n=1 Tax=Saccharopolyspora galaxeae TaxID=2781241 RepID=UPI00190BB21C|nr:hypothetical protein [Saccharopolyspora sp. HNM0986]MBK0866339.1 hypothetical protein [Saccharopolyspora sp. HNM0986]
MPESRRPRATSRKRVAGQRNRPETKSNRSSRVGLSRPGGPPEQEEQADGAVEAVDTAPGAEAGAEPAGEDSAASRDRSREDAAADSADAAADAVQTTPESSGTESSQDASDENSDETADDRSSAAAATTASDVRSEDSAVASRSGTDQSAPSQSGESQSEQSQSASTESATAESAASRSAASGSTSVWRADAQTTEQSDQQRVQAGPNRPAIPLIAAGFVAAFVLACLAVWFGVETYRSSAATANEALVDEAATSEVNGQLSDAAAKIFSYDFADTGKAEQAAKNLLEGDAINEYNQLFSTVKQQAPAQKLVVTTTVKASSVLRLEGDRAEVLLFVDQNATRTDNGQNQVGPAQVVFNAKKHGDQWKITHISQK